MDGAVESARPGIMSTWEWEHPQKAMRLHMIRGSFFPADDGVANMDAKVWSRLPEELIWEVLQFVPVVTHFRLQSVSRKWRRVLTSTGFRNRRVAALASSLHSEGVQQHWVACVKPWRFRNSCSGSEVVDIDLSWLVPRCFWKSPDFHASGNATHSVVAAADGLVCISNDSERTVPWAVTSESAAATKRYCVLNPLTGWFKVLPRVPFPPRGWLPPTPAAVTMFAYTTDEGRRTGVVRVATCDLGGDDVVNSRRWRSAAYTYRVTWTERLVDPVVAVCGGETYLHYGGARVRVLVPGRGPDARRLVEVDVADEPSAALLGVAEAAHDLRTHGVWMAAHRGAVLFVKYRRERAARGEDVVVGVWRLVRERLEWEAVARLDAADVERLTGVKHEWFVCCRMWGACGVREFVYCSVEMESVSMRFELGLNLDTGEWQLVHREHDLVNDSWPLELRPFG